MPSLWSCDEIEGKAVVMPIEPGGLVRRGHTHPHMECACGPQSICAECEGRQSAPCIHGGDRQTIIVHNDVEN